MSRRRALNSRRCTEKQDRRFRERQSPAQVEGLCTSPTPGRAQPKPPDRRIPRIIQAAFERIEIKVANISASRSSMCIGPLSRCQIEYFISMQLDVG